MRTLVRMANANCSYCMNAVRGELLARPLIRRVRSRTTAGCLEVDHDNDDLSALTDLLNRSLKGWQAADNGEVVSVMISPELCEDCA